MKRRKPENRYGPTFAQILVPLRAGKGMSQEELAKRSKLPLRTIQRYELGTHEPRVVDMILIALALDVDPLKLFEDLFRLEKH
jgi:transcriptional regulator with XRE-family HTH domain